MASLANNNPTRLLLVALLAFSFFFSAADSVTTVSISESSNRTLICALTVSTPPLTDHYLNCTTFVGGVRNTTVNNRSSDVQFSETVAGDGFLCGLIHSRPSSTSTLVCWRFSAIDGSDLTYNRVYQGRALRELESGNSNICAIVVSTNSLQCWPWRWFRNHTAAAALANFSKISVGEDFVCGISRTAEKTVTCVGSNSLVVERAPAGEFSEISAGPTHACAVAAADGILRCWGDVEGFRPQMNKFVSLASGENRGCGLRGDTRTVECWGRNGFSLPEPLRETEFDSIEGKRNVFCGVESLNWSLHCWGGDGFYSAAVFDHVLPGPCETESGCECGVLSGAGKYCSAGMSICRPCYIDGRTPSPEILPPATLPPAKPGWSRKMVAFLVIGCVGSASLLLVLGFFLFRFCKGRVSRVHDSGRLEESGAEDVRPGSARRRPVLSKRLSHLFSTGSNPNNAASLEEFPLEILLEATANFSDANKIGAGSFGSVYRGKLRDGREVAVKRAEATPPPPVPGGVTNSGENVTKRQGSDKDRQFVRELEFLSRLHHKNLVRLLGFYEDSDERVLVYEYLPNGTLHEHLHRRKPPAEECSPASELGSWPARIKAALDAARGIQYLHDFAVPTIIHRDIKSANILLDEGWTAKVSDFGLSLMGPEDESSHLSLRAAGTVGYIDPEYFRLQKLTTKSDVYSFGVVLLEILSGHRAIQRPANGGPPRNVVDYAVPYILRDEIHRALDRSVPPPTPYEIEAVAYVGYLAADCVALEGRDRPNMSDVVGSLERALAACYPRQQFSRSTTDSST